MHQTYSIFEIYNGNTSTKVGCQLIFISTIFVTILTYFDIGGFYNLVNTSILRLKNQWFNASYTSHATEKYHYQVNFVLCCI